MKRSKALLFVAALCVTGLTGISAPASTAAATTDEMLSDAGPVGPGQIAIRDFGNQGSGWSSHLIAENVDSSGNVNSVSTCSSMSDAPCKSANFWRYRAVLPFCANASATDCIDAVTATDANGAALPTKKVSDFPGVRGQDYVGDESINLPTGSFTGLVDIPGAPHASGSLYMPVVVLGGHMGVGSPSASSFEGEGIQIGLFAVSVSTGTYQPVQLNTDLNGYKDQWNEVININNGRCVQNDATQCAVAEPLPLNVKFGLRLRLKTPQPGWFSGRIANPDITISSDASGNQILNIAANPVVMPAISQVVSISSLTPSMRAYYTSSSFRSDGGPTYTAQDFHGGGTADQLAQFMQWVPIIGNKASADPTLWQISTMTNKPGDSPCFKSQTQLVGVASTNATEYIDGPPVFDKASQTLVYKVAAPHYNKDGTTVFKGTYDLAIRSSAARCLYGFTSAPISATIDVISDNGTNQVAVSTVGEHDGWLYLSASGFEFSSPTVRVKLTQAGSKVSPTGLKPSAEKSPSTVPAGKTMRCLSVITHKISVMPYSKVGCPNHYKAA